MKNKVQKTQFKQTEITKILSETLKVEPKIVRSVIDGYQAFLKEAIENEIEIAIRGIGTFNFRTVPSRKMVMGFDTKNHKKGDIIQTCERKKLVFIPTASLKAYIKKTTSINPDNVEEEDELDE